MSVALTDMLIDLADPVRRGEFERDPEGFAGYDRLTAAERKALATRNPVRFRQHARSTETADQNQQFNRNANADLVIEASVDLHLVLESNDMVAVGGPELIFTDGSGRLFRAVNEDHPDETNL